MSDEKSQLPVHVFTLPEGIDPFVWQEFENMRKKMKKPLTDYAKTLTVRKLITINQQTGEDPNTVLERSIERGWQGVFPDPERNRTGGFTNGRLTRDEQIADVFDRAIEGAKQK